jgi:predicted MPP superfamily phosphohydrolase
VAGRSIRIDSPNGQSSILVAGDETPWMGQHPAVTTEPHDCFRILLSHTPDNITWARANDFDLMLAGHTHGGQIRLPALGPVYSPSVFDCRFASGVFWLDPTLLHVSRGLSGREPVRYLCRPELTKLTIRNREATI